MIPELPIAMLACARIGAPHTVVFGGFSAEALSGRINDCGAKVLITADGGWRRGKEVGAQAPRRRGASPTRRRSSTCIVVDRFGDGVAHGRRGRDHWWHDIVERQSEDCPPGPGRQRAHALPALHVGHDGQAQGHPAHDRRLPAGHGVHPRDDLRHQARRRLLVRRRHRLGDRPQLHRLRAAGQRDDRRSCTRARPDTPAWDRWWQIIEDYKVTILYCAPTAIRAFMKQGEEHARGARPVVAARPRLGRRADQPRGLAAGTASTSAAARRPIVDTWWQTETGQILITPLPGVTTTKPGSRDLPVPGHRRRRRRRRRQRPSRSAAAATSS